MSNHRQDISVRALVDCQLAIRHDEQDREDAHVVDAANPVRNAWEGKKSETPTAECGYDQQWTISSGLILIA